MDENGILIGCYNINGITTSVYVDPDTSEIYYYDDQDMPYVIFGFNLDNIPSGDLNIDFDEELSAVEGATGIVYDGKNKWVLTDDYKAYRVPGDATSTADYTQIADFSDDTEYEPSEEGI